MMHCWIRIVPPSQEWIETTVLCCSNRHIMRICAKILSLLLKWKDIMLDESSDIPECLDFITCQLQMISQIHRACLYLSSRVQAARDANLKPFDEILKLVGLILTVGDLLLSELQVPNLAIDLVFGSILDPISRMSWRKCSNNNPLSFINCGQWCSCQ